MLAHPTHNDELYIYWDVLELLDRTLYTVIDPCRTVAESDQASPSLFRLDTL